MGSALVNVNSFNAEGRGDFGFDFSGKFDANVVRRLTAALFSKSSRRDAEEGIKEFAESK